MSADVFATAQELAQTGPPPVTAVSTVLPVDWTAADLVAHLGGIPLERIRIVPPPGTATEQDVVEADDHSDRICELIDGVLVEKPPDFLASVVTSEVIHRLAGFVHEHRLGILFGGNGPVRVFPNRVRMPSVCFVGWDRLPDGRLPRDPVFPIAPDLIIEVLRIGNAEGEMQRKLHDYFTAGVRLVWYIDPRTRTARAYTAEDQVVEVSESQSLSGGEVLPGFELPLKDLFARIGQPRGN